MGARRRDSHRTVFLLSSAVALLVLALFFLAPGFLKNLEGQLYDLHFFLRGARPADDGVVIVAVDEKSLARVGRWPWPRSRMADLVRRLSDGGAKAIGLDILLSEPEVATELRAGTRLVERLAARGAGRESLAAVQRELEAVAGEFDHDGRLEAAIRESGRVVLPVHFDAYAGRPAAPGGPARPPLRSALVAFRHHDERGTYPPPSASAAIPPLPRLAAAGAGLGHVNMIADPDGSTRWEAVAFEYAGHYYPALGVEAVRVARGIAPPDVRLDFGRALELGGTRIPLDVRNRLLIDYAGPAGTYRHLSAADVLGGTLPPDAVRDRIVLVGTTAAGIYDLRVTPTSPVMPGVEKHANVVGNILAGRFLTRPDWVELVEAAGIVFWPTLLAWLLARLRPVHGLGAVALLWAVVFGAVHLAFRAGIWIPVVYASLSMLVSPIPIMGYLYWSQERRRRWIQRAFKQFVSPDVVDRITETPGALQFGGEVRTLTVLFADIRDFTAFAERHPPQEVVHMLREYFTRMVKVIQAHQGTLDKFVGDAVMAIFGAPLGLPDHAERACRAALTMLSELEELRAKWVAEGREPLRIGIGINTGDMVVGNLGSEQVFTYTVLGDAVNLAARLEALNKDYQTETPIIISETTLKAAREVLDARHLGEVTVKGRRQSVVVYELRGLRTAAEVAPGPLALGSAVASG
jgi:adenylate cyclase